MNALKRQRVSTETSPRNDTVRVCLLETTNATGPALAGAALCHCRTSSIRRFFARPSSEVFVATGARLATPFGVNRCEAIS